MKPLLGFGSIPAASAIVVMAAQPSLAAPTEITGVNVKQTSGGISLELKTRFGDRPQVFSDPRGKSWVADVINSQLSLPNGGSFGGGARLVAPRGQLDFSGAVKPMKGFEVRFEVFNITESPRQEYLGVEELFRNYQYDGRTYGLSATYKF